MKKYSKARTSFIEIEHGRPLLAGSIVNRSAIESTGQEIGEDYDFSSGLGATPGKEFNHEWK